MVQAGAESTDYKERLIANVKKEVKQLMEESVTKKYVHEESSTVTSLCGAIEACLSQGLRRRALGLFKTSSTTALLHKIGKKCPDAEHVSKMVHDVEARYPNKRTSSSSDSLNRSSILKKGTSIAVCSSNTCASLGLMKYLWIRLALYEKRLAKIIEYLVANASNYYDRESLVADPDYGSILSSLLVGPCALKFTRSHVVDRYMTDPHADELVQRHRISSVRRSSSTCSSRPPIINFKRSLNASSDEANSSSHKSIVSATVAKNYVESLHQNSKATLLYGKNNVHVLPKDVNESIPGYLSLHQHIQTLTVKWTPNQLMNGSNDEDDSINKDVFWAYALNINIDEIVYVHCHQRRNDDSGGSIILVGQDGVQRPPIHFPEGGHMQQFLSCLETGLLPHGQLDPPLWSHRGFGKNFPWPKAVRRRILPSVKASRNEAPIDFVFRIVSKSNHEEFAAAHSILDFVRSTPRRAQLSSCSTTGSSECSNKSLSIDQYSVESPLNQPSQTISIEVVCTTMRRQIISRAFYGWLAYCRHLSTVRTHLSGLVHGRITPEIKADADGLTKERWEKLNEDGVITNKEEFYRLIYFGGVQPELREKVWPYLLGHYSFGSTPDERQKQDKKCKHYYETTMSEWLAVDAIVQQRVKEKTANALAKLSSGSKDSTAEEGGGGCANAEDLEIGELENEVFEDISDFSDPGDLDYEDNERQKYCIDNLTVNSIPRTIKTSTDSGHIEETLIYEQEEDTQSEQSKLIASDDKIFGTKETYQKKQSTTILDNQNQTKPLAGNISSSTSIITTTMINTKGEDEKNVTVYKEEGISSTSTGMQFDRSNKSLQKHLQTILNKIPSISKQQQPEQQQQQPEQQQQQETNIIITNASIDIFNWEQVRSPDKSHVLAEHAKIRAENNFGNRDDNDDVDDDAVVDDVGVVGDDDDKTVLHQPKSVCASPASSNGGVYSSELLENFGLNLYRIEKDVLRCDRNYWYFANENLDKLRNVITTYVWEHLDIGYLQGMCDLLAPLLVIFDDESLSYSCFCKLMERMLHNFPNGGAMDMHFANMRSLIQILYSEMYDLMNSNGDYTHFYFCYRWFLLDFKREFIYNDVFATWEVIWAAKHIASGQFVLFLALALLETYRDIILSHSMDFTDVIKFFNEMAERHNARALLQLARSLVLQLQLIIENK